MLAELALATLMVLYTVLVHGIGLVALSRILRLEVREEKEHHVSLFSIRAFAFLIALVLGLFILHGIEIWSYGLLYLALDALPDLRSSIYFSTITYATIGYDDEGFHPAWQVLAAIEGINGVILLGWSTAFFVAVMGRMMRR